MKKGMAHADGGRSVARSEAIRGRDEYLVHTRVVGTMACLIDKDELSVGPRLGEVPGNVGRTADVEPALDQHPGDAGEGFRLPQKNPVLQPGGVPPVVG